MPPCEQQTRPACCGKISPEARRRASEPHAQRDADGARHALRQHIQWARNWHLEAFDWEQRRRASSENRSDDIYYPLNILKLLRQMENPEDASRDAEIETS